MDLALNEQADFTRWVVSDGLLREPFVLLDVGVQGGENQRWQFQRALVDKGMKPISEDYLVGRPATVDVLFCRDLIDEVDQPAVGAIALRHVA
jgi:hypothetical protein